METARIGDKIRSHGITVTIGKLYYSDCWDGIWDVEFVDTDGNYRHWKQQFDGGEYIRVPEDETENLTEEYKDFYGCTATIEHKEDFIGTYNGTVFLLTIRTSKGEIIHRRKYKTHKGARIAMGKMGDCWHFVKAAGKVRIKL